MPGDELNRMKAQAEQLGPATLTRYAEILHAGLIEMRGATAPRLLVELLCARMLLPAAAATDSAVLQRLEGLERRMTLAPVEGSHAVAPTSAPVSAPIQAPVPAPAPEAEAPARPAYQRPSTQPPETPPAPEPEPAPAAASAAPSTMDSTAIRQIWPELLRNVGERNKPAYALLQNATVKTVEGNTLVLAMPTAGLARQLGQESRAEVIKAALHELVAGNWELRCVHDGATPDGPGAARRPTTATATRTRPAAEARIADPPPPPVHRPPAPRPPESEAPPPEPPPDPLDDVDLPPDPVDDPGMAPPEPELPKPDAVAVDLLTKQLRARRLT
jgi:DNA polymerase-3 subunit gamma/tau